ncbi:ATP-binding protein [Salimicrobium flavidum]|uniref:Putative ATP-dependent DNA helicase recG C-terminal n=1 Tax=Salimicrobium flavidum TaxID=570947 RepID=A0A1N7KMK2_9BACI|nr:ATP-binding protein [Salimicrobium flavidum]SIS62823.1 Putative ATP-dependent DNA helicase recG C-terminal [Salimicrobium flavidum]
MFGKEHTITEHFPHYFLDYREKLSAEPEDRWSNRITSQDGTWSGNLFEFYFKVIERITSELDVPFHLDPETLMRKADSPVRKALREAVLNTIIHANYYGSVGVVIEKEKNNFVFSNPGVFRMPLDKALEGGNSDPRNPTIFKIFSQLGLGERSGYGLESIYMTWKSKHWKRPSIREEVQPERTTLTLEPVSLMPEHIIKKIQYHLQEKFHLLTPDQLLVLATAYDEGKVSNKRLQNVTGKSPKIIGDELSLLVSEELLIQKGAGRGTVYELSDKFQISNNDNSDNDEGKLDNDEALYDKLLAIASPARDKSRLNPEKMKAIILELCQYRFLTITELSDLLDRKSRNGLRVSYIKPLVQDGKLALRYPETPSHVHQAYKTVSKQ